jgi:hypothetical protein
MTSATSPRCNELRCLVAVIGDRDVAPHIVQPAQLSPVPVFRRSVTRQPAAKGM